MKVIIHYEKRGENQDLTVSVYLFRYIRIYKLNLVEYMQTKIEEYLKGNYSKFFSTKSYINYKNSAKIIWNRIEKFKKHIYINSLDLKLHLGTGDPAVTALLYSLIYSILPNIVYFVHQFITIKKHYYRILPQFDSSATNISLTCEMMIHPVFVVYQYFITKRRLKDDKFESTSH
ncbi:MAG: hypothetical protein PWP07_2137 [Epulopiscium sp.]|nr:hypothetical protein [Defluviitaleaceae bacterium]MDK2788892.1 hypothetical protein [Candidatus Epulonipiscium sp.]